LAIGSLAEDLISDSTPAAGLGGGVRLTMTAATISQTQAGKPEPGLAKSIGEAYDKNER